MQSRVRAFGFGLGLCPSATAPLSVSILKDVIKLIGDKSSLVAKEVMALFKRDKGITRLSLTQE